MPVQIEGWIEFSPYENPKEREDEDSWISWMEIGSVIQFNDEINWIHFGNPKEFNANSPKFVPIAKEKGIPHNPSHYLQIDLKSNIDFEKNYGKGNLFGFTHIYFSEIEKINWSNLSQVDSKNSDWLKLFKLIKMFMKIKKIKSDQIRIIAWYNW